MAVAALETSSAKLLPFRQTFRSRECACPGEISQIEVSGSSVFVGGDFDRVGGRLRDAAMAALDPVTGALELWQPDLPDASGTALGEKDNPPSAGAWDLAPGGKALFIVATSDGRIAQVDVTTGAAARWFPGPKDGLRVIAASGSTMYMGGDFTRVDGTPRRNLAAVDVRSGRVTAWRPDANAAIDILVPAGRRVYVAGVTLERVGGAHAEGLAAVDSRTGRATDWTPGVSGSWVEDVNVSERGLVGIGFEEGGVRGVVRNGLAAIKTPTGRVTAWNPAIVGSVEAIAVSDSTLYVGGSFRRIAGKKRDGLAAIDVRNGRVLSWSPRTGGGWDWIEARDGVLYAARRFSGAGDSSGRLIAIREEDGQVLWTVRLGDPDELAVALLGPTLFATRESDYRSSLGAFDAKAGKSVPLGFLAPRNVLGLAEQDEMLYVATLQWALFAVQPASGAELWRTRCEGAAQVITPSGNVLYVGGFFERMSGRPRKNLAAVDAETGELDAWQPRIEGYVKHISALHVVGSTVYVGGDFEGHLTAFPAAD
jgi:outer membrane protein assembly factor BamB